MCTLTAVFEFSRLARRLIPFAVVVLAVGCSDDLPVEPSTLTIHQEAMSVQDMGSNPFINYRDGRINLDVDPGRVIVETEAQNVESVVAGIVSAAGGQLSRIVDRPGRRDWKLLELNARGGPSVTRDVVQALRQDQRISFASHAYRRSLGGEQVLPLNRVVVRFRRNASSAQIESLVAAL